jgi:hypothetical protein
LEKVAPKSIGQFHFVLSYIAPAPSKRR